MNSCPNPVYSTQNVIGVGWEWRISFVLLSNAHGWDTNVYELPQKENATSVPRNLSAFIAMTFSDAEYLAKLVYQQSYIYIYDIMYSKPNANSFNPIKGYMVLCLALSCTMCIILVYYIHCTKTIYQGILLIYLIPLKWIKFSWLHNPCMIMNFDWCHTCSNHDGMIYIPTGIAKTILYLCQPCFGFIWIM